MRKRFCKCPFDLYLLQGDLPDASYADPQILIPANAGLTPTEIFNAIRENPDLFYKPIYSRDRYHKNPERYEKLFDSIVEQDPALYNKHDGLWMEYDEATDEFSLSKGDPGRPKSNNPKGDQIVFRLDTCQKQRLDNYCNAKNTNQSDVIRLALAAYLNNSKDD